MQTQQSSKERRPPSKRPAKKKLEGKSFYLDNVKKQPLILLSETIHALGGRVESFLHKDVDYVVTGTKENLKQEDPAATKGPAKDEADGDKRQTVQQERGLAGAKRPGTPRPTACGSRGKALLEKAIRNNERLQASSVLSSARSWGVKILSVDHALLYLKKLTKERCQARQRPPVVKATVLNVPYLKVEDVSGKYKPLFTLYATFPALCHLGKNPPLQSPPPPPWCDQWAERGDKPREKKAESATFQTSLNLPWLIGEKNTSYCECCQQAFASLKEHLASDQHQRFAMDRSNYGAVDQLVAGMFPAFDSAAVRRSEEDVDGAPTPLPVDDFCGAELHVDESQQDFFLRPKREDAAVPDAFAPQGVPAPPSQRPALPPVLSPEIPFPCFHSSYSDAPALSPQRCGGEEGACEVNLFHVMAEFISALTPPNASKKRRRSAGDQSATKRRRRRRRRKSGSSSTSPGRARRRSGVAFDGTGTAPDQTLDRRRTPGPHDEAPPPPPSGAGLDAPRDSSSGEILRRRHAAAACIERRLIPDPAALSPPSSSDSGWDCGLLSRLGPPPPPPGVRPAPGGGELDAELLHRPCPWTYDRRYESHLHAILQQAAPCGDDKDAPSFSRGVAQTAAVQ